MEETQQLSSTAMAPGAHDGSDGTCDQHRSGVSRSGVDTEATTGGGASAASVAWCWPAENHVGLSEIRELSIKLWELAINKGNSASNMIYEHASCVKIGIPKSWVRLKILKQNANMASLSDFELYPVSGQIHI